MQLLQGNMTDRKGSFMYCSSQTHSLELTQGSCAYASHQSQGWNLGDSPTLPPSRSAGPHVPKPQRKTKYLPIPSHPTYAQASTLPSSN